MSHQSLDSQNTDWNWVYADGDIPCKSKGLVINARVETVLDKPSFSKRDLISPAVDSGRRFLRMEFPERKEYLTRLDSSVLYMAGFCDWFDNSKMPVLLQA